MSASTGRPAWLLLLLVAATGPARAQSVADERGNHFSYGVVVAHDQARDDILIPLRWMGPGAGLRLGVDFTGADDRHGVSLLPTMSFMNNRYGHAGYAVGLELSYSYVRRVTGAGHRRAVFVGPQLKWDLHNALFASWDDEHIYWLNSYTLGPRVVWSPPAGLGAGWAAELEIPLVGFVARPPRYWLTKTEQLNRFWYHVSAPQEGLTFTTVPRYLALHAGLSYRWRRIALRYGFDLATYDMPARVITISNRFGFTHRLRL